MSGAAPPPGEGFAILAHYERFPATIKGAFVLRAEGRNPHLVRLETARVTGFAREGSTPIPLDPVTLDVAPRRDVFVPFELGLTELAAGWYGIEVDVEVDGLAETRRPGERFSMAWPRGTVRRGSVPSPGKAGGAVLDRLECTGDSVTIGYQAEAATTLRLRIDGSSHTVLESTFDEEAGRGRVVAYPLLRSQETLEIEVRGSDPLRVPLP